MTEVNRQHMKTRLLIIFALTAFAAFGDTVTWNFDASTCSPTPAACSNNAATLSTVQSFTPFGETGPIIGATGTGVHATKLYLKKQGGDENGLGLAGAADFELVAGTSPLDMISIDLTNAIIAGYSSFMVSLGSVQSSPQEAGNIHTAFGDMSVEANDTLVPINLGGGHTFDVTAIFDPSNKRHSDVLLGSITALAPTPPPPPPPVPEPGSIVLLGSGLLASLTLLRRKMQR
jgi:hypothetical protein